MSIRSEVCWRTNANVSVVGGGAEPRARDRAQNLLRTAYFFGAGGAEDGEAQRLKAEYGAWQGHEAVDKMAGCWRLTAPSTAKAGREADDQEQT